MKCPKGCLGEMKETFKMGGMYWECIECRYREPCGSGREEERPSGIPWTKKKKIETIKTKGVV